MEDNKPPVPLSQGEPWRAIADENTYTLSIDDAIARYLAEGIPRTRRTVQRYCSNKTLDAHRFAIPYGEKYLIKPESLERHIAYILQGEAALAGGREPRRGTVGDLPINPGSLALALHADEPHPGAPDHAGPQPPIGDSTDNGANAAAMIDVLRDQNTFLKEQIAVKDAQLAVKDRQIADQSERVRETNLLVASLHKLITPLISRGEQSAPFNAPRSPEPDDNTIHSLGP